MGITPSVKRRRFALQRRTTKIRIAAGAQHCDAIMSHAAGGSIIHQSCGTGEPNAAHVTDAIDLTPERVEERYRRGASTLTSRRDLRPVASATTTSCLPGDGSQ